MGVLSQPNLTLPVPSCIPGNGTISMDEERRERNRPPTTSLGQPYTTRLSFKVRGRMVMIPVNEIRWIGAEENYVRVCTDRETHLLRGTMMSYEKKLDPRVFLRVHRSAIVNLQFVKEVRTEAKGDFVLHLVTGHRVAMGRSYHGRVGDVLSRVERHVA
jgi:two-component system LytT family response regulator